MRQFYFVVNTPFKCTLSLKTEVFSIFSGLCVLFMRSACIFLSKKNFKTRSHSIIYTFKNYFVTLFSVFSNKRYLNRPDQNRSTIFRWCEPDFFIKFNYVVALTNGVIYKENAKITINFITKRL